MRGGVGPVSPLRIYLVQEAASVDIPHLDAPPPITRKYLSLVRMKGDGVDGMAGVKGTGGGRTAKVIKLDGAIFRAAVQVSAVAMETQAGHRRPVSLEGQNRRPPPTACGGLGSRWRPDTGASTASAGDGVQPDGRVAGRGQELLVGSDLEPVYLRVRVADDSGAYARRSLPEPDLVVVPRSGQNDAHNVGSR